MDLKTPLHPSSSSQIDPEAMKQQDRGNTSSCDKKKNKDAEAEATLPPTDGMTGRIRPRLEEEQLRQIRDSMGKETLISDPQDLEGSSSAMGERRVVNVPFKDSDIEMAVPQSSDGVPSEQRFVDPSSDDLAREDPWRRLATMVDPLLGVNVQGAFSLLAYQSSDGSSPAKDVLFCLVVFLFVLGFFSALGGKFYRSSKMGVIGLVAAALGFLMTMALVVIHKI